MKLAFSSVGSPNWDLATMVEFAREHGYEGIELRGLQGQMHLPVAPQLAANPAKIADLMRQTGVRLVCLSTSAAFHMTDPKLVAENQAQVREYVELAAKLECPFVRVFGAEIPRYRPAFLGYQRRELVLARIAKAIAELADHAAAHKVTVLIENSGDFVDSQSMWYLVDAVDNPAFKCCWNPMAALLKRERPTISITRLGRMIALVRLCDAKIDERGNFGGYVLPGEGSLEIPRLVQILKGIGYRGFVSFDWPRLWTPALADPEKAFAAAAEYLTKLIGEKPVEMTAYKGDKNAPNQKYVTAAD